MQYGRQAVSRDSPVLTSLRILTFLTRAHVRPETPAHIPLQPLFIPIPGTQKTLLLYPDVFVSTTHSYVYIAFLITTSFSTLCPGSCLLCDTTSGSLFTPSGPVGYWLRSMPFYACRVGTGAAGCR